MNHRRIAGVALVATVLSSSSARADNVLLVFLDDVGRSKLSSYAADYPTYAPAFLPNTQAVDSVAAAGIRFRRAWANPLCSPTRGSFQTGVYPFRHGVGTALGGAQVGVDPTAFTTIAQHFAANGYKTGLFGKDHTGTDNEFGVVGVPPVSPFYDVPHASLMGWDRFFGIYDGYPGAGRSFTNWERVGWVGSSATGYTAIETANMTDRTAEVTLNWINGQTQPWFAVAAFSAPHSPDTGSYSWQYGDADVTRYRTPALSCLATTNCANEPLAVYQGLLEHVDLEIEALLDGIPDAVMDETLIIIAGDNGTPLAVEESVFNAAGRGKGSIYEGGVGVPLIVADGATWRTGAAGRIALPGRTADYGANVMDIYHTTSIDMLGIGLLGRDSRSFTACFANTDTYCGWTTRRFDYAETFELTAGGAIDNASLTARYGYDKMNATYDPALNCLDEEFFQTDIDPFEVTPLNWPGVRGDRLRDYVTALLATEPTSWAFAGGAQVPFCP